MMIVIRVMPATIIKTIRVTTLGMVMAMMMVFRRKRRCGGELQAHNLPAFCYLSVFFLRS